MQKSMTSELIKEEEVEELLGKFVSDPDLATLEANLKVFNVMSVLKVKTSETVFSSFLAWLLNPRENHGLGPYFLKYFLMRFAEISNVFNVIDIDKLNLSNAIVRTEEIFHGKRADITVRIDDEDLMIIIENKVRSTEGEEQTKNYVKFSQEKYPKYSFMYVYLTPFGDDADSKEFISLDYGTVKELLVQTIKANKDNLNEEILNLIQHFLYNLEENILNEGKITDLCKTIYERHKEAIETIIANKPKHIKVIEKEIIKLLKDYPGEWKTHPTKTDCYIFKKQWLEDFKDFYVGNKVPFFFYNIHSWNTESIFIAVQLYIDRTKPGKYDVREIFTEILEDLIDKSDIKPFYYNKTNIAKKIKDVVIKKGYEYEQDLKNVALKMKDLIDITIRHVDKAVDVLKSKLNNSL